MITKTFKKLYYIPGIISLVIVPVLFYYYGSRYLKTINQGKIDLFWFDPELTKKYPEVFSGQYPQKRNYIDIELTGDEQGDKVKLNFAQVRIREILAQNDSTVGIHFNFSSNSEYWTFVKALDILRMEGAKTYMPYENNLWFYHIPPDTTIQAWTCGYQSILLQPDLWEEVKEKVFHVLQTSGHVIVGYCILLIIGVRSIKRRINSR
jgi:hypothetical protein